MMGSLHTHANLVRPDGLTTKLRRSDMSDWKLLIEDDVGETTSVPLLRGLITIGRKEGNTVRLTARNVSRFHARLVRENDQLFVEDLESYNGVRINGDRIQGRIQVREGDLIEIGDYHLALQMDAAHGEAGLGGKSSSVAGLFPDSTDDAFAGETQRWEPSPSQLPTKDGTVPSGLDLIDTDETARMPLAPDSAEMHTVDEQSSHEISDPLMPGLSSLRSLAAMAGDAYETPAGGAPLLQLAQTAQETEPLSIAEERGVAHIPPVTEPYFQAFMDPPAASPPPTSGPHETAKETPARVSLVDAPTFEPNLEPAAAAPASIPEVSAAPATPPERAPAPPAAPATARAPEESSAPAEWNAPAAPSVPAAWNEPAPSRAPTAAAASDALGGAVGAPAPLAAASAPPVAEASTPLASHSGVPAELAGEATEAMPVAPKSEIDTTLPRLVALNTVLAGASFPIEDTDMVVGRVEGCDLLIQHKSVSRSHCRMLREGDVVRVVDLKSANGTLVNGVELDQAVLRSGDVLELGTVLLRFAPVGDDFSLSTEEIIRAREAEAKGSDWQEDSTQTSLSYPKNPNPKLAPVKWAALVGLVVVVAVLAFVLGRNSDRSPERAAEPAAAHAEADAEQDE